MKVTDEKLKEIYIMMKRCRAFSERALSEYQRGLVPANLHPGIGQEAVGCGVCCLLRKDDYIIPYLRYNDAIAKGANLKKIWAELLTRKTGCGGGKVGYLHLFDLDYNIMPPSGIVGGTLSLASGIALACKKRKEDRVTVCFFGDGATSTGAFHEGMGMAAAYDLPVVFVCENNQYAISTYWKKFIKLENIAERAHGYGIPGISVDGMDAIAVAEAAGDAIERARKGKGPTFIEGRNYRYHGHGPFEDGLRYRTKEEIEEWKKRDPVKGLYSFLLKQRLITEEEEREIDNKLSQEMDEAVEFALNSPEPTTDDVMKNIYVTPAKA